MKLKATATRTLPETLIDALNAPAVVDEFYKLLKKHFRVEPDDIRPGSHYVQETDLTIPASGDHSLIEEGVSAHLTGVSVTDLRSPSSFDDMLEGLAGLYTRIIKANLDRPVHLFCTVQTDKPIPYNDRPPTCLIEKSVHL